MSARMARRSLAHPAALLAGLALLAFLGSARAASDCLSVPSGAANAAPAIPDYEYGSYAQFGAAFEDATLAFPSGTAGDEDVAVENAAWRQNRLPVIAHGGEKVNVENAACLAIAADGDCITSLDGFAPIYYSLAVFNEVPSMTNYSTSDAAFARQRITAAPLLLTAVDDAFPLDEWDIVGLEDIIADTGLTLPELVGAGRVFVQDYRPLTPWLYPSPLSHLEIPAGLFFVDGAGESDARLMPLAIKFSVFNNNTYSPKDSAADWLLAKGAFNAIDTGVHASIHFLNNHFILENFCVAFKRNLLETHPLYPLIMAPCRLNAGVLKDGISTLLADSGEIPSAFDNLLTISGVSGGALVARYFETYDWDSAFLETDVTNRGVKDVPGFAFYEDGQAIFDVLLNYTTAVLGTYYPGEADLTGDAQLQALLTDMFSGNASAIPGFPSPADVTSAADLARIITQVMWIAGVQHHGMNSDKVNNYDFVYPGSPGKLFAPPPAEKGVLTEDALVREVLLPLNLNFTAQVPGYTSPVPGGPTYFGELMRFATIFSLRNLNPNDTLAGTYGAAPPADCPNANDLAAAAEALTTALDAISERIHAREAEMAGPEAGVPPYLLLDPARLPTFPVA